MQIAVTPNASTWIVVPEFPPPGWERAEARRRTSGMTGADPRRRANLEELLVTLGGSSAAPRWRGSCTWATACRGSSPST